MAAGGQEKTWGELLTTYCEDRNRDRPPIEKSFKFTRRQGGVVKEKERLFNPITQRHRSSETERAVVEKEEDVYIKSINHGMRKALTTTSLVGYDIVSQEPKYGIKGIERLGCEQAEKGKRTQGVRPPESNVHYNIVTLQEDRDGDPQRPQHKQRQKQRQYDILRHTYVENHDAIIAAGDKAIRDSCAERKLKQYDPIRAVHNNSAEEAAYHEARAQEEAAKRKEFRATTSRTPACVQRSEGHNYDIVAGAVHNPEGTSGFDRKACLRIPKSRAVRMRVEGSIRQKERASDDDCQRSLNKIAYQRQVDRCRTGYDIITGEPSLPPLTGKGAVQEQNVAWKLLTAQSMAE